MKIRTGFVSNSSSSSFCVVGVDGEWALKLLLIESNHTQLSRPNHGEDCECKKCIAYSRIKEGMLPDDLEFSHGIYYPGEKRKTAIDYFGGQEYLKAAGVDAQSLLEKMDLPGARQIVHNLIKEKLGVDVPLSEIQLLYGEAGDG